MKLIALIVALALERAATQLLRLRELGWFDRYFDRGLDWVARRSASTAWPAAVAVALLPALPVLLVGFLFRDLFWDVLYFAFAVAVLLFSFGPRDLGQEVEEYVAALDAGENEQADRVARQLLEAEPPPDRGRRELAVEEAIFVQAVNRVFGVIFWFVVLGPAAAWLFRVTDLFRHRAARRANGAGGAAADAEVARLVAELHGVLAWVPARLAALGYAVVGSFEAAFSAWRSYAEAESTRFFHASEEIVAAVGRAALALPPGADEDGLDIAATAQAAFRLVVRAVFAWTVVIALMTVGGLVY
jgi:membrane protein required for beta-lactamase induction